MQNKGGRPNNPWAVAKRSVPVPALDEFEVWLAQWKVKWNKENKK